MTDVSDNQERLEFEWLDSTDSRLPEPLREMYRYRDVKIAYVEVDGRWAAVPFSVELLEDAAIDVGREAERLLREELGKIRFSS